MLNEHKPSWRLVGPRLLALLLLLLLNMLRLLMSPDPDPDQADPPSWRLTLEPRLKADSPRVRDLYMVMLFWLPVTSLSL